MSDKMSLVHYLRDDRAEATIELHQNGVPLGHIFLQAFELEGLIRSMGSARANMVEEVPRELDPGTRVEAIIDPAWHTQVVDNGIALSLRHPGLGWVSFLLPHNESQNLGRYLTENSEQPE